MTPFYVYVTVCVAQQSGRHQVPPKTAQELTDVLIQVWEEIPQDSSGASCLDIFGSAYRPYTLLSHITSCSDENSHKLHRPVISTFPFVILNPVLKGSMILVSIDHLYVFLLSMNFTMYISKDFQHQYFVH